jgi:hypothetical protein
VVKTPQTSSSEAGEGFYVVDIINDENHCLEIDIRIFRGFPQYLKANADTVP